MANQQYGAGTLVQFGGLTSPPTYVTIASIKGDIKGAASVGIADISTHDTMAVDRTKRKGGTTIDEGKYTFDLFSDLTDAGAAGHATLMANRGKTGYFKIVPANYSPAKTITFQAVIASISDMYPMENYQTWSMELDVTGPKVFA